MSAQGGVLGPSNDPTTEVASGRWSLVEVYESVKGGVWPVAGVVATGGTVTESGGYRIHTFTSSGTLTVTQGGDVEYLVVAGGGGASGGVPGVNYGSGGAGGVLRSGTKINVLGTYPITVGAGGAGALGYATGSSGSTTTFDDVSVTGGGGAASGRTGGSNADYSGGTNASSVSSGGGAGAGANGSSSNGGSGVTSSISGASVGRGGGGAGANVTSSGSFSDGGGSFYTSQVGDSGLANSGGGGGGGPSGNGGGAGGSGIVIVRYPI